MPVTPDTLRPAARRLYGQWEHLEIDGEAEGYPLATLAAALTAPLEVLYALVALAEVPWAPAFDPELAADLLPEADAVGLLGWLGQFAGVTAKRDLPAAGQRLRLLETGRAKIGSPDAIIGAARQRAIGPDGTPASAMVLLVERVGGDPYHFAVTMREGEVPDPAATRRDIDEVTPAGRYGEPGSRFDFNLVTGGDFDTLAGAFPTFSAVTAEFASLYEVAAHPLGMPDV